MSDLIDRQAAIDALGERPMVWVGSDYELGARNQYDADILALETVPSAQPEQKTGKWLWADGVRCSVCNHKLQSTGLPSYCPKCGVKMRGE